MYAHIFILLQKKILELKRIPIIDLQDETPDGVEELNCENVLNLIVPMKEWEEDGKYFRQKISNQPATKLEVKKLSEKLDMYLEQFQAREVGICPIKQELYSKCFSK